MATNYSILSIQIRPEIQEKISVVLLLFDTEKIFFNYSRNKLHASKSLLSEDSYKLLKDSIANIKSKAKNENDVLGSKSSKQIAFKDEMLVHSFSPEYISYLSRYNNNILSFTSPKQIDLSASENIFKNLFAKFIDSTEKIISGIPKLKSIEAFKTQYKERFLKHFNIEKEVSSKEIPYLIMPVKVDLLGQNDVPVYAQTIDMDRRFYDIENDIAVLQSLYMAFNQNKKESKGFVVAQEPSKNDIKQHQIWTELKKAKWLEYVDISEGEKVIKYAEKHNVQPLIIDDLPELSEDDLSF